MTYNIHPIFVHFPIAFLLLYSLIKIVPFKKWFPQVVWRQIEVTLLVVGVIGAFVADSTGELAQHLVHPNRQLVHMHSTFAGISTFLYALLLGAEILPFINTQIIPRLKFAPLLTFSIYIQKIVTDNIFSIIIAILGLLAISVTGLLGGAIVFGATADPVAGIVLKLLHITL